MENSSKTLSPEVFRKQIAEAKNRITKIDEEVRERTQEKQELRDLIRASVNFLPEGERTWELVMLDMLKPPENIAEAVRLNLYLAWCAELPLTPVHIREFAEAGGFDFSAYSNPMASIHSILKRMREANPPEVEYDESAGTYKLLTTEILPEMRPEFLDGVLSKTYERMAWEAADIEKAKAIAAKTFKDETDRVMKNAKPRNRKKDE